MSFIDYQGTKENRYTDVLEFAKAQQEEEARRLEDAKVGKWVTECIGDDRYVGIALTDLIKYIIVWYRKLVIQKDVLLSKQEREKSVNAELLWKDFSIAIITKQLEPFRLTEEKRDIYYQTFLGKVFKLQDVTLADKHYRSLVEMPSYERYFADCFDLVQEKQFWKWIGYLGEKDNPVLVEFVNIYEQLSVLLGYYMFLGIGSGNDDWMRSLDIEHQLLEKIKVDYERGLFMQPNISKLHNPLYEPVRTAKIQPKVSEECHGGIETLVQEKHIEEQTYV